MLTYSIVFAFAGRTSGKKKATTPNSGNHVLTWKINSILVRSASQPKKAEPIPPKPNHQTEENTSNHPHLIGFQVCGIHHNRGEGGSDDQSRQDSHHERPAQVQIRHRQRERSRTEYGKENDILASIAIAQETAEQRANGKSRQVGKQAILRLLHREVELLHQIKGEITRHAGIEEIFRENHQHKDGKRPVDRPLRKRTNAHRPLTMGSPDLHQYQFIPISDARQQHGSQQRRQCKPPDSMLPVRYDNQRRQQRPDGAAAIPADLKNGLRQTFPPTPTPTVPPAKPPDGTPTSRNQSAQRQAR